MARLLRSLLFVPGNNARFIEKAKILTADIICFDLEDSVPTEEKKSARNLIKNVLTNRSQYRAEVYVRTNSPTSGMILADLAEIVQKGIDGIVIPKVNDANEITKIEKILISLEKKRKLKPIELMPSIESAAGVVNAYRIASSSERVSALVFGVFDLLNDLGVEYTKQAEGARYSRSKIPIDAKAAGKYAIDAIWQDLNDTVGLKQDCLVARNLGYSGKSIIHPDQIEATHRVFHPTPTEIEWAKKVIEAYSLAKKKKKGATKIDGKMIDEVHFKRAKTLLDFITS
ncbi:MAG: CoA ester lyase [Thaumarchaeota archaeon 13_1_40CM_38_12]|nr:MAG: CoA ester lyase [Thaumarchaeota archaeon 13_1_40CM_38_12]OLC33888.1 MAG: CoA ester lyase [Thaumarchaeota archaeon 13_1_40CM_4_38_7]OLD30960.1 MAG: CoA ester lyase [Thaumarchaeota archaeon 13_1_40CM_2_39_7]OLE40423.1 MAG: CoA ester lyase [Thaumarchaeota archaeon 13_1_20CM_2_38_5]TLY08102.1 MAG: CoA ester lyase [Nitrososphaerota archaeon]